MTEPRIVIIGAGFGGIGMAVRLRQEGYQDVVIVERSGGVGGTWRDNTYPGAACDIPSHLYSFSFHPGTWRRRFSEQPDILRYLEDVVRIHGLERQLRTSTEVESLVFDERSDQWEVRLGGGEVLHADVVVSGVGQLNRPYVPDLPGLDGFAGPVWHSARWRHDVDLTGRRVAVVGTGASAIQFVPEVAKDAAHVTVFQRSAPYVMPKPDRVYDAAYRRRRARIPGLIRATRLIQYLRHEVVTHAFISSPRMVDTAYQLWEQHVRRQVPDPELRRLVTPGYTIGCKRVLISNDWYPTLMRDDVDLVASPVAKVTADAVVTEDGQEHACDAIVLGTGFRSTDFLMPMRVVGRDGRDLHEVWRTGAEAYRGITVAGFPNLFLLYGPNTNLGTNSILYMLESQFTYVLESLRALEREGLAWMDVTELAQTRYNEQIQQASEGTVWESGCTSWYTTPDGRNTNNWPAYTFQYRQLTKQVDLGDHLVMPRRPVGAPTPAAAGER
jgi:cation diffusion facilitator CzcD-associated flavoprotein CzcO